MRMQAPAKGAGQPKETASKPGAEQVFVEFESPAWGAWVDHRRRAGEPPPSVIESRHEGNRRGWWFAAAWPPGHQQGVVA